MKALASGQPLFCVVCKWDVDSDQVCIDLLVTNFVEYRGGGWIRTRSLATGKEASIRPSGWSRTRREAFDDAFESLCCRVVYGWGNTPKRVIADQIVELETLRARVLKKTATGDRR